MMRRIARLALVVGLVATTLEARADAAAIEAQPTSTPDLPAAQPSDAQTVPDDATLEAAGATIRTIDVHAQDIFNPEAPGEDNAIFRAANKLHVVTRESVLRKQLLFKPGDRYSRRVLDETERVLRSNGYLYEARIRPVRYEDGQVDVQVETRDVWTLRLGLGVGRGGGENAYRFGISDENFLGTGKEIAVRRSSDVDRTETLFRYRDPNMLGHHLRLTLAYSENSDGSYSAAAAERPFYSLDSRWSAGLAAFEGERVDSLYAAGEVAARFRREQQSLNAHWGFSRGLNGDRATRFLMGYSHLDERFEPAAGEVAPADFPQDKILSYPWVGFEQIQDRYLEVSDFDRIQRTEDHNLGRELRGRIGFSSTAFGADRDRLIYDASYAQGFNPGNGQLAFVNASVAGRWADGVENLLVGSGVRYDVRNFGRHMFHAALRADAASNLDAENQLLLGGDNGLRGYPLRYLSGDRRVLITLEQRVYTDWHILKLVHVGGVVFYDGGLAWNAGNPATVNQPLLHNVGVGLRLCSSRAALGGILKIDLAFPLNAPPGVPSRQVLISTGATF